MRPRIFASFCLLTFLSILGTAALLQTVNAAQTPSAPPAPVTPAPKHPATLQQLMRGTLFFDANVVYAAQGKNPADIPLAKNPSSTTNPLESSYGKWEAVENASLAMIETADLLTVPGRVCSNGRPVPTSHEDWPKLVQGLRNAGMQAYMAAKAKDQDKILDASDAMATACSNCHNKYRDTPKLEDRCR